MNRQPDWCAQRIKDEVAFFMQQIEQERLLSEQIARKAIAKARADSRKYETVHNADLTQKLGKR